MRWRTRLLAFAHDVNQAFATLGFPLCEGGVMAGNPEYCMTVTEWKDRFMGWLTAPTPHALLGANIAFDFRPLFGATTLADDLRSWVFGYSRENKVFLRLMAQNALESGAAAWIDPHVCNRRRRRAPGHARHQDARDAPVRRRGTRFRAGPSPFMKRTRSRGCAQAGRALRVEARHVEATVEAFHFLQLLRLRLQDETAEPGSRNRLDPDMLNEVDQRMLKEAFRQARKLQDLLARTYDL